MAENPKTLSDPALLARARELGILARETVDGLGLTSPRGTFAGYAAEFSGQSEGRFADGLRQKNRQPKSRKMDTFSRPSADSIPPVHLVIDGSESMKYQSGGCSKFQYAQNIAACLAYALLRQEEPVQVSFFNERIRESIPPVHKLEELEDLLGKMAAWEPTGPTKIGESIREFSETLGTEGAVVLLSDFFEEDETWAGAVERLRFHSREVLLVQVMDPQEIEFPFEEKVEFEEMEGESKWVVEAIEVREAYLAEIQKFFGRLREVSAQYGSQYILGDTSGSLAGLLAKIFLSRRRARSA